MSFVVQMKDETGKTCTQNVSLVVANSTWGICGWPCIVPFLTPIPGACTNSAFPAWDGVFNKSVTDVFGDTIWYFTGRSINGKNVSADDTIPNFQNITQFASLVFDPSIPGWNIFIVCYPLGNVIWSGDGPSGPSVDPFDPRGQYTNSGFGVPEPAVVSVVAGSDMSTCIYSEGIDNLGTWVSFPDAHVTGGITGGSGTIVNHQVSNGFVLSAGDFLTSFPLDPKTLCVINPYTVSITVHSVGSSSYSGGGGHAVTQYSSQIVVDGIIKAFPTGSGDSWDHTEVWTQLLTPGLHSFEIKSTLTTDGMGGPTVTGDLTATVTIVKV